MIFTKYNNNPLGKKAGDCVIRALSTFMNESWMSTYDALVVVGRALCVPPTDNQACTELLRTHGLVWTTHTPKKGAKRPKVKDFMKGTHLLACAHHLTVVKDGVLYDMWDCREKAVYRSCEVRE